MLVGYYVHHAGAGHRVRSGVVGAELMARGHEVVRLGSGGPAPGWVDLARDDAGPSGTDPHAGGALHWAPVRHDGYRARMEQLAAWVATRRPAVVVVDVSVEVAALVRLLGVPVVLVAQPGARDDDPHLLGYRLADAVVAPWPQEARPTPALHAFADKTVTVGGISRFASDAGARTGPVVVLGGQDAVDPARLPLDALAEATGGPVVQAGGTRWRDDLEQLLRSARLVVGHTGQNAVADVAALHRPLLMVPQERPHDEQNAMAAELDRLDLAAYAPSCPDAEAVRESVDRAVRRAGGWDRWRTEGAAQRAADVVEQVGRG